MLAPTPRDRLVDQQGRPYDISAVAPSAGLDEAAAAQLDAFRRWLIGELVSVGPIGRRSG